MTPGELERRRRRKDDEASEHRKRQERERKDSMSERNKTMMLLHGMERQHAEDTLREALEDLAQATTHQGDLWYTEEELRTHVLRELDEVYDPDE